MAGIKIIDDWYHMYRLLSKIHASCSEMLREDDCDRTAGEFGLLKQTEGAFTMIKRTIFCASLLILALAQGATSAQAQTEASKPAPNTPSVKGSGTPGKITKWLDSRTIGNSVMTEQTGNIGIGTTTPESKLTVEGAAELGIILRVTNTGAGGSGVLAQGGSNASGAGGEGVIAGGGEGSILAGDGVNAFGGRGPIGGNGVTAGGGTGRSGNGGAGVRAAGGFSVGPGNRGGDGVFGRGGAGFDGASVGRAGFFFGDVDVTGTLTKGGGSFKIDHPLDPENRYLSHSFVESPDMMNVYNGNITTDQNGAAVVELPGWFEALNTDFRYQLTVIGAFAQAMVAEKIEGNRFTVRTSTPNVEVSWQVTGIRRDPWAKRHRIAVEQEKPERERGHYLYPEVYDQPEEKNVEWARHPELMRQMQERREQIERRGKDSPQ